MSNNEKKEINVQGIKEYWLEEALEALKVADHLYEKMITFIPYFSVILQLKSS